MLMISSLMTTFSISLYFMLSVNPAFQTTTGAGCS